MKKKKTLPHHRRNGQKPRAKTAKETAKQLPALIPQSNGKGSLYAGGMPGNAGGTGRPPSAIRALMRQHLDFEVLADLMAEYKKGDRDTLEVAEYLAKYGLGGETQKIEVVSPAVRENLRQTIAIINEELDMKTAERVLERLDKVWSDAA